MDVYTTFLSVMSVLFLASAAAYLALMVLAGVVAAGFYFFRRLM